MKDRLSKLENMLITYQWFKKDTEQVLVQYMEHILALEQAKSRSDEIIEAQAKRIESLEKTVKKLEARLKNQQREQIMQHGANLRRIK